MTDQPVTDLSTGPRDAVDFDHHSPVLAKDPYPTYERMRRECPVAWSEHHGGFWALTDYESVYAATADDDTFRSAPGNLIPLIPYGIRNIPIDTDSPETQQFREMLLKDYSPARINAFMPRIYEVADELIDDFIEAGRCDFVQAYAMPLPARIILELLGFDKRDWFFYAHRIHFITHRMTAEPEAASQAGLELAEAVAEEMADRRTNGYRDDQTSKVMQGYVNGAPITDIDVTSYLLMILFGGLDTSTGVLANSMVALYRDPALRQTLIDHPEYMRTAVEELLRYQSPVSGLGRTLSKDVEFYGQQLRAGDRALLVWGSANRDEKMFERPDEVDIHRNPNRHLAFGVGLHRCIGSNLGRAMFRVMLERILARVPDYELEDNPEQYRYDDASAGFGFERLPGSFTPGERITRR